MKCAAVCELHISGPLRKVNVDNVQKPEVRPEAVAVRELRRSVRAAGAVGIGASLIKSRIGYRRLKSYAMS